LFDNKHKTILQTMSTDSTGQRRKSKLTKEASDALGKLEQDESFLRNLFNELPKTARSHIGRWRWPSGREPLAEDIAADAVYAIWRGEWTWNPYVRSLFDECRRVIWSRVWQELQKAKRFENLPTNNEGIVQDIDGSIQPEHDPLTELEFWNSTAQAQSPSIDLAAAGLSAVEGWGDLPISTVDIVRQLGELRASLPSEQTAENELLKRVVDEIALSYPEREPANPGNRPRQPGWANRELAAKLGVSESEIVNAMKRLRRIFVSRLWDGFLKKLPNDGRPWLALASEADHAGLPDDWKQTFAGKHSMTVDQVVELGMKLVELFHDWFDRTFRDEGVKKRARTLRERADRIEENILAS
jgi:DNA-directed RNA polymerase specialized sigma24 family protein